VEEVTKTHGEGFDWENSPVDGQAVYVSGGGKPLDGETLSIFQFCECKLVFIILTVIFFYEGLQCSLEYLTHSRQDL
jgi:hypothetical protein